jgi:hypothetical protein
MGVRAAHEHHLLHATHIDVRDELGTAPQVTIVLSASHRRANAILLKRVACICHEDLPSWT